VTELAGVSRTAISVAAARARESARADRLFDDPYAARFLPADAAPRTSFWTPGRRGSVFGDYFALRTHFFDTFFADVAAPQVVILGAGLDTRAYRLDWPDGTVLFELDLAPVLDYKRTILADDEPRCRRVEVPVDLTGDWGKTLRDSGFQDQATAWLAEGLLMYLGEDNVHRLLTTARELSTPDSRIAVEHPGFSIAAAGMSSVAEVGADRMRELAEAGIRGQQALRDAGWAVVIDQDVPSLAHAHGRPVPPIYTDENRAARARLLTARPAPA
jgi:methyltransferase (TIGR00027 family)